jgi:thiol-disulfide isomerase/thioredoxin
VVVACHEATPAAPPARAPSAERTEAKFLVVGDKVPAFRLDRLDAAGTVGLPNGKVTILTFVATWNGPAKKSMPKLQEIHLQYAPRGLDVIAVFVDDTADYVREFGAQNGVRFPIAWDNAHALASKLGPDKMPTTYILDRNAVVRFIHGGYHDDEAAEIAREAASLL